MVGNKKITLRGGSMDDDPELQQSLARVESLFRTHPGSPTATSGVVREFFEQREEEAAQVGATGYMVRAMTQATLPYRQASGNEFMRTNGRITLTIMTPSRAGGLPYGTIPRLLIAYISSEAVKNMERTVFLGRSLTGFMRTLGFQVTGGKQGSMLRFQQQARRLFTSNISVIKNDIAGAQIEEGCRIADKSIIWWDPQNPAQQSLFESTVHLTERFFKEIIDSPVPINMDILREIRNSPMSMDIYFWLEARKQYLTGPAIEPWEVLGAQFGCEFNRPRDFRRTFIEHLQKVGPFISKEMIVDITDKGLHLKRAKLIK